MAETSDARTLSSGLQTEEIYADYANSLKALANTARKTMINTGRLQTSTSASKTYSNEVDSLNSKLEVAKLNQPKERKAQLIANSVVKAKQQAYPDMTDAEVRKAKQQALTDARLKTGASRSEVQIKITNKEWDAIQSGAISDNKLSQILRYTDLDSVRKLATPRTSTGLTPAQASRVKVLASSGYTQSEIASFLNVSVSTVNKYLS